MTDQPVRDEDHLRTILDIPFSADQMRAITVGLDSCSSIVAGAGSGKTAVMAARVVWLVGHEGVPPERILAMTFTNKAANELGARIRASLDRLGLDLEGEPTTSTYHAFAGRLITEHGLRLGIEPDLRVVSDASRFQRFARAIERYEGSLDLITTHIPWLVPNAIKLDSELAEHVVSTQQLRDFDARTIEHAGASKLVADAADTARKRTELSFLIDAYREAKAHDGVMDFADQMSWGAQLAELDDVRESLQEQFDVVLLDEYQDTSVAQRDMLVGLFKGLPVTAVGDPAQGIYGWRGAAIGNLEEFLDDFEAPAAGRRFSLTQTLRCRPEIIAAANEVVAEFMDEGDVDPLTSAKATGGKVSVALYDTVSAEITAMVDQIAGIRAAGDVPLRKVAILVRSGAENGEIVKALRDAHVPFEIVGLQGLLSQPEVTDVVSLLQLADDATANPAALRLLSGPRFAVGPRDLALLGRRAASLSSTHRDEEPADVGTLAAALTKAVEGTDPTEVVSLADALADPGTVPYSEAARGRFAELASMISSVRRHAAEPLLELVRRAVRVLDLDIELDAGDVEGATDNLALFLDAVADYAETDRFASLAGLLSYLNAESEFNFGMEVSTPSEAESVKLLTIHKAKGLEWHTVFVPFMSKGVFPSALRRPNWISNQLALPTALRGDRRSLPQLPDDPRSWTPEAVDTHNAMANGLALMEERRLAYVAYTRAEERLVLSGHWWGRTQINWRGPSEFLERTRDALGEAHVVVWAAEPVAGAQNPHIAMQRREAWPAPLPDLARRRKLADAVRDHLDGSRGGPAADPDAGDRLGEIEHDLDLLLAEATPSEADQRIVSLPATVSTTSVLQLTHDPGAFARSLARPMPRQPSAAARFGTRFHAWVEAHFGHQGVLLDPEDLPGRGDTDIGSDAELDEVIERFRSGPYADRTPVAIEAPFSIVLAGQQVIGQIDAVFETPTGYEVVDWKTNREMTADPLQLAVYRLAWAELQGIDPERVSAAFYYVRRGESQAFDDLPGRGELEDLLAGNGTVLG